MPGARAAPTPRRPTSSWSRRNRGPAPAPPDLQRHRGQQTRARAARPARRLAGPQPGDHASPLRRPAAVRRTPPTAPSAAPAPCRRRGARAQDDQAATDDAAVQPEGVTAHRPVPAASSGRGPSAGSAKGAPGHAPEQLARSHEQVPAQAGARARAGRGPRPVRSHAGRDGRGLPRRRTPRPRPPDGEHAGGPATPDRRRAGPRGLDGPPRPGRARPPTRRRRGPPRRAADAPRARRQQGDEQRQGGQGHEHGRSQADGQRPCGGDDQGAVGRRPRHLARPRGLGHQVAARAGPARPPRPRPSPTARLSAAQPGKPPGSRRAPTRASRGPGARRRRPPAGPAVSRERELDEHRPRGQHLGQQRRAPAGLARQPEHAHLRVACRAAPAGGGPARPPATVGGAPGVRSPSRLARVSPAAVPGSGPDTTVGRPSSVLARAGRAGARPPRPRPRRRPRASTVATRKRSAAGEPDAWRPRARRPRPRWARRAASGPRAAR